ncbi:uncharacterized protein FIBRA_03222 [Fibroporia radiculosa]|uniref:Telomere-associated protein Rif1 N-terminal domain-containing protein n=1 Tax=Fibroporia radiculosa TaxID=599839 RepID=J4H2A3_9APHY|nr:uncharacterized protein FIBRA_03222 [Fibroporia radiculosa]CCM01174.1 predicted protein [Fibroporia radiculosa]
MSLPTPPSTSHRDKENRLARFSGRRVVWSEECQYRILPSSPPRLSVESSAKKTPPVKSILKKTTHVLLPLALNFEKETTPEPSDPLADLHYLEGPVSKIVAVDASLRDLIEAYSVLAARLRSQHREMLVDALVRDLSRIFVDPGKTEHSEELTLHEEESVVLLSPKGSPVKKKGMSEEQVKFARDLCTVCHAVIKFLNVLFTFPAIYQIFTDKQLSFVLTQVLAIPLANELPTPNARKTCALSMWLLQTQRLPAEVLVPAKDRIAYALRRGIEGELGKEGKKGSVNDGLKAIHDLSLAYPNVFVPAFIEVLPSIFSNLLASTLVLRSQACHALGGFAYAAATLPQASIHARISNIAEDFLTSQQSTSSNGPVSPSKDPVIIRTLRTTLGATDPKHVAQGPVWAWSVLASFVVLLGPTLYINDKLTRSISALFSLGMRHQKSSVRALGCLSWRCMTWAYFHPPLEVPTAVSEDDMVEDEEDIEAEEAEAAKQAYMKRMNTVWKVVQSVVDMGAGVTTIGALLSQEPTDELSLRRALGVLRGMSKKGGHTCKDALDAAVRLVGLESEPEWNAQKLLPLGLFSANPGLLTAEYKLLPQAVKPLFEQCAQMEDLRSLTREELAVDWVFNSLLDVWKEGLGALRLTWGCELPSEIIDVWYGLVRAPAAVMQGRFGLSVFTTKRSFYLDADDDQGIVQFANQAAEILIDLLKNPGLDLSLEPELGGQVPTSPVKVGRQALLPTPVSRWNLGLKLYLIRELWNVLKTVFTPGILVEAAGKLFAFLIRQEMSLVGNINAVDEVRYQWASLCAEVIFDCETGELDIFWRSRIDPRYSKRGHMWNAAVCRSVWAIFFQKWQECAAPFESAIILLGVPFMNLDIWDMSTEDVEAWDKLLQTTIAKGLDYGIDSVSVIDQIAAKILSNHDPTLTSSTRVVDLLLSHLEINEARQIPSEVMEFANDTLVSSYPPEPRNKVTALWMIRSLTRIIDACPIELSLSMFEILQEGLSLWIADDYQVFTAEEYAMDILPVYQTVLLGIQSLTASIEIVEALTPLIESAFCGRQDKPEGAKYAFHDFWLATYANVSKPSWGWPQGIQNCLQAPVDPLATTFASSDQQSNVIALSAAESGASNDALFAETEEDDDEATETAAVVSALLLVSSPPAPSVPSPLVHAILPSTPESSPRQVHTTTPVRLHQPANQGTLPAAPPALHVSPFLSLPVREPVTPKRESGSSPNRSVRRQSSDKENVPPLFAASVAERVAVHSPATPSILGKRNNADDVFEERSAKKPKLDLASAAPLLLPQAKLESMSSISNITTESSSTHVNVPFQGTTSTLLKRTSHKLSRRKPASKEGEDEDPFGSSSDESSGEDTTPVASTSTHVSRARKRKAVTLDAVEVPTFSQVLLVERRASLRSTTLQRTQSSSVTCANQESSGTPQVRVERPLRRTRSATKLLGETATFEQLFQTPTKRRKTRVSELKQEARASPSIPSSPLRAIREAEAPIAGSDDSIMLATPTKSLPQLSSDDDPFMGQVTPLGVVSPALRRTRMSDSDLPSSDDSTMSASPSREHVKRRIARLPSSRNYLNPSPLKMRLRTMSDFDSLPSASDD